MHYNVASIDYGVAGGQTLKNATVKYIASLVIVLAIKTLISKVTAIFKTKCPNFEQI